MKKKAIFFIVCLLLVFLFSTAAYAYNLSGYRWSSNSITYYYDNFNSTATKNALSGAAYSWSGLDASLSFSNNYNVYCSEVYVPDVTWDGITNSYTQGICFTSQTILINTDKMAYYYPDALQSVAAHEFGHAFGLNENPNSVTIMNNFTWGYNSRYGSYRLTTPQTDDRNGVNILY